MGDEEMDYNSMIKYLAICTPEEMNDAIEKNFIFNVPEDCLTFFKHVKHYSELIISLATYRENISDFLKAIVNGEVINKRMSIFDKYVLVTFLPLLNDESLNITVFNKLLKTSTINEPLIIYDIIHISDNQYKKEIDDLFFKYIGPDYNMFDSRTDINRVEELYQLTDIILKPNCDKQYVTFTKMILDYLKRSNIHPGSVNRLLFKISYDLL